MKWNAEIWIALRIGSNFLGNVMHTRMCALCVLGRVLHVHFVSISLSICGLDIEFELVDTFWEMRRKRISLFSLEKKSLETFLLFFEIIDFMTKDCGRKNVKIIQKIPLWKRCPSWWKNGFNFNTILMNEKLLLHRKNHDFDKLFIIHSQEFWTGEIENMRRPTATTS